jgi:HEAT repeat protein
MRLPQMLRSDDRRDFNSALEELSSIPQEEAIRLLEELALDANGDLRSRAIDGMATFSANRAEALAIHFLNDREWYVRVTAIHILWKLGSCTAAPLIAPLLAGDPDEVVRSWAAFFLGDLGDASVLPVLMNAAEQDTGTNHEGEPIRETALQSIKKIRSRLANQTSPTTHC